jgi:hypothetical protein
VNILGIPVIVNERLPANKGMLTDGTVENTIILEDEPSPAPDGSARIFRLDYKQGCGSGSCRHQSWDQITSVLNELIRRGPFTCSVVEESKAERDSIITAKDGLLWRNGRIIDLPEADRVAREHGFAYAEQLVKHLSNNAVRGAAEPRTLDGLVGQGGAK